MRPRFICLEDGCGTISERSRCPEHDPRHDGSSTPRLPRPRYDSRWRALSEQARAAQPWCTVCGTDSDLVLDHVLPGTDAGGLMVLCRRCNSRKSGQDRRLRRQVDRW
jgi:5-methylcytosine-specific restriction endonuclease McrA